MSSCLTYWYVTDAPNTAEADWRKRFEAVAPLAVRGPHGKNRRATTIDAITAHRIVMPVTRPNSSWLTVAAGTVASVERTHCFFTLPSQRERFDGARAVLGGF